ncbi:hypothetical protein KCV01_g3313, partial [Aureobasidium melanogenum]
MRQSGRIHIPSPTTAGRWFPARDPLRVRRPRIDGKGLSMQAHLPSLIASLRALSRELLALLELIESQLSAPASLPGLQSVGFRPLAGPLPPPFVPLANDDINGGGGLGFEDLKRYPDRLILFVVGPWDGFEDGDTVQILHNGRVYGTSPASATDRYNSVNVFVPAKDLVPLDNGIFDFIARVNNILGIPVDSAPTPVRIRLLIPGGPDPISDTPWRNENLAPPKVVPDTISHVTPSVTVTVPAYLNMAEGDSVRLRWAVAGNEMTHVVTAAEVGKDIVFVLDREFIMRGGFGGGIEVVYDILDLAYNYSLWSPPTLAEVDDPEALDMPWVDPTVDDEGNAIHLVQLGSNDVSVVVYGAYKDDIVIVHFIGTTAQGVPTTFDTPSQTATINLRPLNFTLPNRLFPDKLVQGTVEVWFTLQRGATARFSARRRLKILGKLDTLKAPVIVEAIGNQVDPNDLSPDAHLRIDADPLIAAGTRVSIELNGRTSGDIPVGHQDYRDISGGTAFPLFFVIPGNKIAALAGSTFTVQYFVEGFDAEQGMYVRRVARPLALTPSPMSTYRVVGTTRDLPKPTVPVAEGEQLDPDKVDDFANLDVIVAYERMANKDNVRLTVIGTKMTLPWSETLVVNAGDTQKKFNVPKANVTLNDGGDLTFEYKVVDAQGGSGRSEPLVLHVGKGVGDLPPPSVDEEAAGNLLPGAIANGITVRVPPSVAFQPGDRVTVTMVTAAGERSYTTAAKDGQAGLFFTVPPTELGAFLSFDVNITYTVIRDGIGKTSQIKSLHVMPYGDQDSNLPTPAIDQAVGSVLDMNLFDGDPLAKVAPWPLIALGQRVWFEVRGTHVNGTPDTIVLYADHSVTASELTVGLYAPIPRGRLKDWRDGSTITVTVLVTFDKSSDKSHAARFPERSYTIRQEVLDEFVFDPTPHTMDVGATYTRIAKGGKTPYTYTSSNSAIATVTANGLVTAVKDGSVIITASDSASPKHTGSYTLTVLSRFVFDSTPHTMNTGTTYSRTATGGKPPYTYTSSNTAVATVDVNGRVTAHRIGSATITASDSASPQHTGSFALTVNANEIIEDFETAPIGTISPGTWRSLPTCDYMADVGGNGWVNITATINAPPYINGRSVRGYNAGIRIRPKISFSRLRIGITCSSTIDIALYTASGQLVESVFVPASNGRWYEINNNAFSVIHIGMQSTNAPTWSVDNITFYT